MAHTQLELLLILHWVSTVHQFQCYAILDGLNTHAAWSTQAILLIITGIPIKKFDGRIFSCTFTTFCPFSFFQFI